MKKEFLTYEQALALKELGFHKETSDKPFSYYYFSYGGFKLNNTMIDFEYGDLTAPLIQQAFRFFRDRKMLGEVRPIDDWNGWTFRVLLEDCWAPFFVAYQEYNEFKTFEEAEQACLNKLIEIAKETYKQD